MKIKATHYGTCQVCRSFQKLPGGVLSKHGYTVADGWFEGVCIGAGHKPYETHTDMVAAGIEQLTRFADRMESEAPAVEAERAVVWNLRTTRFGRVWESRRVLSAEGRELMIQDKHSDGREWKRSLWVSETAEAYIASANKAKANWMRQQATMARTQARMMAQDLKTWTPKELKPVK